MISKEQQRLIEWTRRLDPVRFNLDGTVPLLQEDDIRDNIRARIGFEGVIGKTDCAQLL